MFASSPALTFAFGLRGINRKLDRNSLLHQFLLLNRLLRERRGGAEDQK
jgi:hypothetical protein